MLYIVATPIGNLKDITLRAIETLEESDGIICEDTRRSGILLSHYNIKKPLFTLNDFNEPRIIAKIIDELKLGKNLVLISDAGTPLVSDPGYKLVRECLKQNVPIDAIPGPSSVIEALVLSGMPPDKFMFLGYLPEKPGKRKNFLETLKAVHNLVPITFIAFVAPHKLNTTMENFLETFGDINVTLAHELTKLHQSVETKTIHQWLADTKVPKGEYIMLFHLD